MIETADEGDKGKCSFKASSERQKGEGGEEKERYRQEAPGEREKDPRRQSVCHLLVCNVYMRGVSVCQIEVRLLEGT